MGKYLRVPGFGGFFDYNDIDSGYDYDNIDAGYNDNDIDSHNNDIGSDDHDIGSEHDHDIGSYDHYIDCRRHCSAPVYVRKYGYYRH
jgi:hypothetical protein